MMILEIVIVIQISQIRVRVISKIKTKMRTWRKLSKNSMILKTAQTRNNTVVLIPMQKDQMIMMAKTLKMTLTVSNLVSKEEGKTTK